MTLVPLLGFVEGDTLGLLVLADAEDTLAEVGLKLGRAAAVRVDLGAAVDVWHEGRVLPPELSVADSGLGALERIDLRRRTALGEAGG
jgi:Toluene-4-monooxygenase system protein B (TmoB)